MPIFDNLVLVPAMLNHAHRVLLLVDPTAGRTLLNPATAERLGLAPGAGATRHTVRLVGGQEVVVPFVRVATIQLGEAVAEDVEVGIYPVAPGLPVVDGILGGDFLDRYMMTVDRAARQLRLDPRR